MPKIRAQKIPQKEIDADEIIMRFCYYFPHYSYKRAKKMPFIRIIKMLKVADKERATFLFELTQIAAGPHTKDGEGVKDLLSKYESIITK